jgi:hypothetical protein
VRYKQIRNCGQVGKEFPPKFGEGKNVTKDFLESLIDNIVRKSVLYYEKTGDYVFTHGERPMHSVVCPSIAAITPTFLMEHSLKRKSSKKGEHGGFVDYWISYRKCAFFMELKHSFFAYRNAKNPRKDITKRFESALNQLGSIRKDEYLRLGKGDRWVDKIAFETITFYKGSKNKISKSDLRNESFKSSLNELMKNREWNNLKPNLWALWILDKSLVKPIKYSNGFEIYPAVAFVGKVIF